MREGRWSATTALLITLTVSIGGCAARGADHAAPGAPSAEPQPLTLPEQLSAVFDEAADVSIWSALFVWADTGDVILAHNPDTRLLPASNMKLVTLATAAQRLGWAYRFETIVYTDAPPVNGVLDGNLYVKGSGDPTLGWPTDAAVPTLRRWARELRAQGLVRIEGDIVGDADALGADRLGDSWSWDDLTFAYSAPYAGLTFHENTVAVVVTPGAVAGAPAHVALEPVGSGLEVAHDVTTVTATDRTQVRLDRALGNGTLHVGGQVSVGEPPVVRYAAVPDPPRFFLQALRLALAAEGIEVRGQTRLAQGPETEPSGGYPVRVVHASATLADLAVRFMKESQNLYGEALLHALAPTPDATLTSRRAAVQEALSSLGVETAGLQVADGSGLSRRNFVTARTLVRVLQAMTTPPHRDTFRRTLPVAGVDGTLERRLAGTACEGRVRAKTGTLSHARALSGFIESASGREIVFSVLANNHLQPTSDVDLHVDRALLLLCR